MNHLSRLSLGSVILINLNIMAGAGIFVNIVNLTRELGCAGGLLYAGVGLFMFPLIFTFAQLVKLYPSGGFYSFACPMSPFLGFLSNWTYFFGKLASASLLLHIAATFLKLIAPNLLQPIAPIIISLTILSAFICLNFLSVRIGDIIQRCFFAAKSIPLFFLIGLGIYRLDIDLISNIQTVPFSSFIIMLPSVLYCFSGFEAACSISRNMLNPEVNAPKAIFYSFFSIITIYVLFQTLMSLLIAPKIHVLSYYGEAYPFITSLLPINAALQAKITTIISFLIGFSAMGAAYGLLFSNSWNLYTLAQNGHVFASRNICSLNIHGTPTLAVLAEGVICTLFLLVTHGDLIPLQQTATLGCTITYTISTIAFLRLKKWRSITGMLSLATCLGFIGSCIASSIRSGTVSLILFLCLLTLGIAMYRACCKKE